MQRLTAPKLKSLYNDLMIQDKEEITHKRVKSEGGDKEGLKEASLRRKLTHIMNSYGLSQHFEDDTGKKQKQHSVSNNFYNTSLNNMTIGVCRFCLDL